MSSELIILADAAKQLRLAKSLTQSEAGSHFRVSQARISQIESGRGTSRQEILNYMKAISQIVHAVSTGKVKAPKELDLTVLTKAGEIAAARKLVREAMLDASDYSIELNLGHKARTFPAKAHHIVDVDIWTVFGVGGSLWNTYGIGDPDKNRNMICHLTVPRLGINRTIGGCYAKSAKDGRVYILHRGKIGGGRAGIGKTAFFEKMPIAGVAFVSAQDGDIETRFALVGSPQSSTFVKDVAKFVRAVSLVKASIVAEYEAEDGIEYVTS